MLTVSRRQRLAEREAEQIARRAERDCFVASLPARRAIVLAGIAPDLASLLVNEVEAVCYGDPMILSRMCELLRAHGLKLAGQWPDSFTQPKEKR